MNYEEKFYKKLKINMPNKDIAIEAIEYAARHPDLFKLTNIQADTFKKLSDGFSCEKIAKEESITPAAVNQRESVVIRNIKWSPRICLFTDGVDALLEHEAYLNSNPDEREVFEVDELPLDLCIQLHRRLLPIQERNRYITVGELKDNSETVMQMLKSGEHTPRYKNVVALLAN